MRKACHSKETLIRIIWCCLNLILCLLIFARGQAPKVWVNPENSFFSDYVIENDRVHFSCHLELYNRTTEQVKVVLTGDFDEDQQAGLIKERYLIATDSSGARNFIMPPGRSTLDVEFVDAHGSTNVKQNRLLPEIHVIIIDPHAELQP